MKRTFSGMRLLTYVTLRRRIIFIFLITFLLPFLVITTISYMTITSILTNKIQSGIRDNLNQTRSSLENAFSNLNHVSQQLAFQGSVGINLERYLNETEPFQKANLIDEIVNELRTISFTNPNIGLTLYYFQKDGAYLFENFGAKEPFDPGALPMLAQQHRISYLGPHVSRKYFQDQIVVSVLRKVDLPSRDDVFVYIESGYKLAETILHQNRFSANSHYVVLDSAGRVVFNELSSVFPVGRHFPSEPGAASGSHKGYYWFKTDSHQGWSIVSVIPSAEYMKERNLWLYQIAFLCLVLLSVTLLLAWLLWKMVYRPLNVFNREIKRMAKNDFETVAVESRIPEFDYLLKQMRVMKTEIKRLFQEVEQKEKRRADLEIEKLLYQINPHFLMNTLDTAHWLAVMKGQTEIDRLIVSLNKLLYHNLGKTGEQSTVREELDALREYVTLQQIRYDFDFKVDIRADERVLETIMPRFVLQPLVENALYHGLNDDGVIQVSVEAAGEQIEIRVVDNGEGMNEEQIRALLHNESRRKSKVGMGIGMNYVKRMLESYYQGEATMDIASREGEGTTVLLRLPLTKPQEGGAA